MTLVDSTIQNSKEKQWQNTLKSSVKLIQYAKQQIAEGEIIEGIQTLQMCIKSLCKKHFQGCSLEFQQKRLQLQRLGQDTKQSMQLKLSNKKAKANSIISKNVSQTQEKKQCQI